MTNNKFWGQLLQLAELLKVHEPRMGISVVALNAAQAETDAAFLLLEQLLNLSGRAAGEEVYQLVNHKLFHFDVDQASVFLVHQMPPKCHAILVPELVVGKDNSVLSLDEDAWITLPIVWIFVRVVRDIFGIVEA